MKNENLTFSFLENKFKKYIKDKKELSKIKESFVMADKYHKEQKRKSGVPYIQHLLHTANILIDLESGSETIILALLHDILEDTPISKEEISKSFGEEITNSIVALTKIRNMKLISEESKENINYEYIQQLIIGMLKDPMVIIVKLADRLHNMRTLTFLSRDKQKRIAKETMEIFVPISHKLSIHNFKIELEDLCFYYLQNKEYNKTKELVDNETLRNEKTLSLIEKKITTLLTKNEFDFIKIYGRKKHLFSIYKKMDSQNKKISEILDLLAIRIITNNKLDCYRTLGLIHENFRPIPTKLKDFISMPKENLYQALHTTVIINKITIEIQIRDYEMENIANWGVASHYLYKEGKPKVQANFFKYLQEYSNQYFTIKEKRDSIIEDAMDDLFGEEIPVLTPKGEIIQIKNGASVLDFAFKIHVEVGSKATNAFVNGKLVPTSTILKVGDLVEVLTDQSHILTPKSLNEANTKYAKNYIHKILNKTKQLDFEIEEQYAKQIIKGFLETNPEFSYIFSRDDIYDEIVRKMKLSSKKELWNSIIDKKIHIIDILNAYFGTVVKDIDLVKQNKHIKKHNKKNQIQKNWYNDIEFPVNQKYRAKLELCKECYPVFGEPIIGTIKGNLFSDHGKDSVIIHKLSCSRLKGIKKTSTIQASWFKEKKTSESYQASFKMISPNTQNILILIIEMFYKHNLNITSINSKEMLDKRFFETIIIFEIKDIDELSNFFIKLKKEKLLFNDIIRS